MSPYSLWVYTISFSFCPFFPFLLWNSSQILSLRVWYILSFPCPHPSFFIFPSFPLSSSHPSHFSFTETSVRCYHWVWCKNSATLNCSSHQLDKSLTEDFQRTKDWTFLVILSATGLFFLHFHCFQICLSVLGNGTPDQSWWGTPSAPDWLCALSSYWGLGTYHHSVSQLQSETRPYEELGQPANISVLLSTHL